ncbi:MAG: hypothetical protein H0U92_09010 [Actinobacteria bacterium]|nr:hypothetical protein [Actinomycetota bacterium]
MAAHDTGGVGFNPLRQQQRRSSDYLMIIAGVVVVAMLVAWAANLI